LDHGLNCLLFEQPHDALGWHILDSLRGQKTLRVQDRRLQPWPKPPTAGPIRIPNAPETSDGIEVDKHEALEIGLGTTLTF